MAKIKLHEILAIEKDSKNTLTKVRAEALKTFVQKQGHFDETRKTYSPFKEGDRDIAEQTFQPMVTTVDDKLKYVQGYFRKVVDQSNEKEMANCKAYGDIVVVAEDGSETNIASNVPVQMLVQLENHLIEFRTLCDTVPTLDPNKKWTKDEQRAGVYQAEEMKAVRTKKEPTPLVLHAGTDKHKPQVEVVQVDNPVGEWTTKISSGRLTPIQKSELLGRIDALVVAVKSARARANSIDVESRSTMGRELLNFING